MKRQKKSPDINLPLIFQSKGDIKMDLPYDILYVYLF